MFKLLLELIFLKTCSVAKSTATKRCFCSSPPCLLASSSSIFPPGIPQKPHSRLLEGAAAPPCPHSASSCPRNSHMSSNCLRAGPGAIAHHTHAVSHTASGAAPRQPTNMIPLHTPAAAPGVHWGFIHSHCSEISRFFGAGFSQNTTRSARPGSDCPGRLWSLSREIPNPPECDPGHPALVTLL